MKRIVKVQVHILILIIGGLVAYFCLENGLYSMHDFTSSENRKLLFLFVTSIEGLIMTNYFIKDFILKRQGLKVMAGKIRLDILVAVLFVCTVNMIYVVQMIQMTDLVIVRLFTFSILVLLLALESFVYTSKDSIAYGNFLYDIASIDQMCKSGKTIIGLRSQGQHYFIRCLLRPTRDEIVSYIASSKTFTGQIESEALFR